jgi:hypothetical protein
MRMIAGIALVALVAAPADPAWSVARSPHFEVYATGSPKRAADALEMFEDAYAFYGSYLSLPPSTRPPIRVIVFSGDKEYAPYQSREGAEAFYQPARDRDYIVMKNFGGDSFRIVAHEYAHAALGLKGADLPPWLSEGLAEFFSSVELIGNKARLGEIPDGRVPTLRKGELIPLADLLAVRLDSEAYNKADHAGLFYAESWALTHMLLADNRYKDQSAKLLTVAQQGKPSAELFAETYGKTPADIEKDLRAYARRQNFPFFTINMPKRGPKAAAGLPAAVPPFDARLVVAGMVSSQSGKDLETRAALDALDREQPNNLTVLELRAFFALRTAGSAASEPEFQRAVEHGSQDPSILGQYAIQIGVNEPQRALELLTRALAVSSSDPELRIHAAAMLIRLQKPAEAVAMIAPIAHVPSAQEFAYYQIVANSHAMNGDFAAASEAAARVVAAAHTPEEMKFAATFLASVGGPPDAPKMIEGRIKNLDCDGVTPVIEIAGAAGALKLAIDDPNAIVIAGGVGLKLNLGCGEQDVPARVGYTDVNPPAGTAGRVRYLDLRKKAAITRRPHQF